MNNGDNQELDPTQVKMEALFDQVINSKLEELKTISEGIITKKIDEFKEKQAAATKVEVQKRGKSLNDFLEFIRFYSTNASTVARSLALGGIAIIWIFKRPDNTLPPEKGLLNLPLYFLALSLGLDLIQYLLGAIAWKIFYECKYRLWKNGGFKAKEPFNVLDIPAPNLISIPIYILWLGKILAMAIAYYYILQYLSKIL